MRVIGIVGFILTLVWVAVRMTEYPTLNYPTPNCETLTPNCKLWIEAKDKVVKIGKYDDG